MVYWMKSALEFKQKNDILKFVLSTVIKQFSIWSFSFLLIFSNHKNVIPSQYKTVQEYNTYFLITFLSAFEKDHLKIYRF